MYITRLESTYLCGTIFLSIMNRKITSFVSFLLLYSFHTIMLFMDWWDYASFLCRWLKRTGFRKSRSFNAFNELRDDAMLTLALNGFNGIYSTYYDFRFRYICIRFIMGKSRIWICSRHLRCLLVILDNRSDLWIDWHHFWKERINYFSYFLFNLLKMISCDFFIGFAFYNLVN
jgi:hypothetical protein